MVSYVSHLLAYESGTLTSCIPPAPISKYSGFLLSMPFLYLITLVHVLCWWRPTSEPDAGAFRPWEEQQAVAYIRAQYPTLRICLAPRKRPVSLTPFQEMLVALNPTYTMAYLDSVDRAMTAKAGSSASLSEPNAASCDWEVVLSPSGLPDFLVCEVFPSGDRTFSVTHVYLFRVEAHQVRFLRKVELNYN